MNICISKLEFGIVPSTGQYARLQYILLNNDISEMWMQTVPKLPTLLNPLENIDSLKYRVYNI